MIGRDFRDASLEIEARRELFPRLVHRVVDFKGSIAEITADRGYGYGENLKELENRKIKSFVPRFHSNAGALQISRTKRFPALE